MEYAAARFPETGERLPPLPREEETPMVLVDTKSLGNTETVVGKAMTRERTSGIKRLALR